MADSDQDRLTIPRVALEAHWDLPWLVEKLGPWKAYDAQGNIKAEGSFWKGQMDGHWIFWYANGQKKADGVYVNDLREGKWVEWDESGEVISEQDFREGKPSSEGAKYGRK
jgi:antitoxin component YwqK of YwqJK toxin-antitoxin module